MATLNSFAEEVAAALLSQASMRRDPPVDVEALAAALGISAIVDTDMAEDGRLDLRRGAPTIYLRRRDVTPERRRFTIAHELGHLALGVANPAGIARRYLNSDEERVCDEIAAAILIPTGWLSARFGTRLQNLSTLRQVAHTTETSLAAALVRCREVLRWPESLVRFTNDENKWRYQGGAGIPRSLHTHIHSAPGTSVVLDALPRSGDHLSSVPIVIRGQLVTVDGQFSVSRSHAVGLVRLPA